VAELIIKDIFRRLDKITIDNSLSYSEFNEFYQRLSLPPMTMMNEETFNREILAKYGGQMNKRGFLNYWKDVIKKGETDVYRWFQAWGYSRGELWPEEARSFMISMHSMEKLSVKIG